MKKHQHQLVTILVQLTKLWKMKRLKITMISLVSVFIYLFLILHVWFSVLLVNSPTPMNSTQNENISIAESQHDLELSRIPRPAGQVPDDGAGRAGPGGLHVCLCGKECIRYENFLIDSTHSISHFSSKYGLTKHKESCTRPVMTATSAIVFTCEECKRTFGEKRYLLQHIGSKRCSSRKEILDNTVSFSLALTESPASLSRGQGQVSPMLDCFKKCN